jgi:hypothetical protein
MKPTKPRNPHALHVGPPVVISGKRYRKQKRAQRKAESEQQNDDMAR